MLTLSVLDQSPVRAGATPAQAIAETMELAQACERWGYRRYWVAEHHNSDGLAGTAPEILIARLGAATSRIRLGSGGVMLSHYSALKVAETFRMLEALYPGRIDLGIGRAPGSDGLTAAALRHGPGALPIEQFPRQIADLMAFLGDEVPDGHPFKSVRANPRGAGMPEFWLLGSSDQSAGYAAYLSCAFSFAHFINDHGGPEIMAAYREHFRRGARELRAQIDAPRASVAVFVLCADSEQGARRLALSRDLWRLRLDRGIIGPVPSVEEAEAYPFTDAEMARVRLNRRRQVVGDPGQVKARLLDMAADYGVDEIVVVSICHDFSARLRSYELLAQAFGLTAPLPAPVPEAARP